ncbi:hypothetical protein ACIQ9E_00815 [Streptomyces sp. NPDC094448]|uniref:hypothetical protein n=1 Tax=Streptomyces sp. NPDC094448 TaxID=3366063 RepID=UPI00380C5209
MPAVTWSDEVHEVLVGDPTAALAYTTPQRGVVVTPVSPLGLADREAGTLAFTSALAFGRKLNRILRDPRVALCYHARDYGSSTSRTLVLAQGDAEVSLHPPEDRLAALHERMADRFGGRKQGTLWDWIQYEADHQRAFVDITVTRLVTWGERTPHDWTSLDGSPWPDPPGSQDPPARGTHARIDPAEAARRLAPLPHRLIGYLGSDGFPVVRPVQTAGIDGDRIRLEAPTAALPPGGRRAGLLGHRYTPHCAAPAGWSRPKQAPSTLRSPLAASRPHRCAPPAC